MKPVVVRNIERADSSAIGTMEALGVSTVHEALGRSGLMKPYMRPVWADDDGVVIVPKKLAIETAQKAQKRFDDEDGKRRKLASGVLGLDMYNMREPLAKAGLVYVDDPEDV